MDAFPNPLTACPPWLDQQTPSHLLERAPCAYASHLADPYDEIYVVRSILTPASERHQQKRYATDSHRVAGCLDIQMLQGVTGHCAILTGRSRHEGMPIAGIRGV